MHRALPSLSGSTIRTSLKLVRATGKLSKAADSVNAFYERAIGEHLSVAKAAPAPKIATAVMAISSQPS
jgi:hypothetical protein